MEYYVKEPIVLREYGKIIQKYVYHIIGIEDKNVRTKLAYAIVDYMAQLTPSVKSTDDYRKKLWDHLFFIADYKLDVDAPYEIAQREFIVPTPTKLEYPRNINKFRHYGRYIVEVINEAKKHDEEKRKIMASSIAGYMKVVYKAWNSEIVNDAIVKNDLLSMSDGLLEMEGDQSIPQLVANVKSNMNMNMKNNNNKNNNNNNRKKKKKKPMPNNSNNKR